MYLKRQVIGKFWPVARKGKKYLAVATHEKENAIPLVVIMRDILKLIKNNKELKKLLRDKSVLINGKIIRETNYPVTFFDSISFPNIKKSYRAILKGKKMGFEEIHDKDALTRIYKVIGRKQLNDKKIQINLNNGRNVLSSEKISLGDFVLVDVEKNKILKVIPLQRGVKVVAIKGKNIGERGKIKEIIKEHQRTIVELTTEKGEIKVESKNIFVIE